MPLDKKGKQGNRVPIRFLDSDEDRESSTALEETALAFQPADNSTVEDDAQESAFSDTVEQDQTDSTGVEDPPFQSQHTTGELNSMAARGESNGPLIAELVATRAELKRVQAELNEYRDRFARRQADFENYRKRVERERSETYNGVVADVAAKLLPVLDNLKRALDVEASVEGSESDEFRHFLSGVDLIFKQLSGVIEALGVKPIPAVGERFDPHIHEAVATEPTDNYEPDTIMQEIVQGYRLCDKLIRPALVKVATRK
jgi:molecular chaperone GrpE